MGTIIKLEKPETKVKDVQGDASPSADEPLEVWECQCGCRLFYLTKHGHLCSECDTLQVYG